MTIIYTYWLDYIVTDLQFDSLTVWQFDSWTVWQFDNFKDVQNDRLRDQNMDSLTVWQIDSQIDLFSLSSYSFTYTYLTHGILIALYIII